MERKRQLKGREFQRWVEEALEEAHRGKECGRAGEPGPEEARWMGEEVGDMWGLSSPVCRRHSSSSLLRLRRFFSLLSFSTCSCRLAFSSDSCLFKLTRKINHPLNYNGLWHRFFTIDPHGMTAKNSKSKMGLQSSYKWHSKSQVLCCWHALRGNTITKDTVRWNRPGHGKVLVYSGPQVLILLL